MTYYFITPAFEYDIKKNVVEGIFPNLNIEHQNILHQSDLVVTFGQSSALTEALLFEKPIILVNMFNENYPFLREKPEEG